MGVPAPWGPRLTSHDTTKPKWLERWTNLPIDPRSRCCCVQWEMRHQTWCAQNFMVILKGFPESNSAWSLGWGFHQEPLFGWPEFCFFLMSCLEQKHQSQKVIRCWGYNDFWSDESSVDPFFWTSFHCDMIHLSLEIEMHTETEVEQCFFIGMFWGSSHGILSN